MKKNLTKIVMLVLTICMMIAVFAVVTSAATETVVVTLTESIKKYDATEKTFTADDFIVVSTVDGELDVEAFEIKSVYFNGTLMEEVEIKNVGMYKVNVKVKTKGTNTTGRPVWQNATINYEITKATPVISGSTGGSSTYGEVKANASGKAKFGSEELDIAVNVKYFKTEEFTDDGENAAFVTTRPTAAGSYTVLFTSEETDNFAVAKLTKTFEIAQRKASVAVEDCYVVYGDEIKFTYTVKGFLDTDNVVVTVYWDEIAQCGTYPIFVDVEAADGVLNNYDYDGAIDEDAYLYISQRVLTAEDFDVENLVYNGKVQLPKVEVSKAGLGAYGDAECGVEIVGSARKYGGTYYVTIVALKNDNYTIDAPVKVQYTIVADGVADRDTAVGEFVDGVINAGETLGEVVEVVAPVVGNIGKFIFGGIKAGVSALVNDFFGRVFG